MQEAQYVLVLDHRLCLQFSRVCGTLFAIYLVWVCIGARTLHAQLIAGIVVLQALVIATAAWSLLSTYWSWVMESNSFWDAVRNKLLVTLWHFEDEPLIMRLLVVVWVASALFLMDGIVPMIFGGWELGERDKEARSRGVRPGWG